jgi:AraC-like DNA-binding protein
MSPTELDVVVRVAGATLLLWAAFAPQGGSARARRFFVPMALCLCGFLAGNTPDPALRLSPPLGALAALIAGYAAVFLWWWCLAVFDRAFRPRGAVLAVGAAWIAVASADRGVFGQAFAGKGLSWLLIALGLAMIGHLAWRLLKDRSDDLIDRRRQARVAVVAALAAQLLADMAVDLVFGLDWGPRAFTILQNAAFLAFTGWLLSLDLSQAAPAASGGPEPASPEPAPAGPEAALTARLRTLMETDRLYLNPDLTFDDFARAMGAPERTVRRLINQQLGHDHFRSFLNAWRVDEARRLLTDPARRDDKLIAIALDSGFASLPSFNRVFRDMEGRSPSAFREAVRPDSEDLSAGF